MRAVLTAALEHLPTGEIARIAMLAEDRDYAAALRLTAGLLHSPITPRQRALDLVAACALWLGVAEYRDERAALELAQLALAQAGATGASPVNDNRYPPPLHKAAKLEVRLREQARHARSMAPLHGGWARVLRDLHHLAKGDPLAGLDAGGQPRQGWDL